MAPILDSAVSSRNMILPRMFERDLVSATIPPPIFLMKRFHMPIFRLKGP